ncbi:uncharacterized protein [Triticum aestivum]|uniref:uncharacterized protein n=1 Tax=Triticum aestivum TaxID=4565 RepID=UPI001D0240D5|nr:uncharacterized protein LOC123078022 [Triticum aestivum]
MAPVRAARNYGDECYLAIAALFGASFAAASAYCMYRKTLDQLLRFAHSLDRDHRRRVCMLPNGAEDSVGDREDAEEEDDGGGIGPPPHRDHDCRTLLIPPRLPPIHTGREGFELLAKPEVATDKLSFSLAHMKFLYMQEGELEELEKGVEPAWEHLVHPLERIIDRLNVVDHIKAVKDSPDLCAAVEDVQLTY